MYGAGGVCECGGDIEGTFGASARGRDVGAAVRRGGRGGKKRRKKRSRGDIGRLRDIRKTEEAYTAREGHIL